MGKKQEKASLSSMAARMMATSWTASSMAPASITSLIREKFIRGNFLKIKFKVLEK
jgi:hypothetical protein